MKITILATGKIKEKYFEGALQEYKKRLGRYCKFEITEVADEKTPDNASSAEEEIIRAKEGERLKKYIKSGAYELPLQLMAGRFHQKNLQIKLTNLE